ncbi:hypothetical protein Hanom_Chr12g01170411 [Helianthus anomalus]
MNQDSSLVARPQCHPCKPCTHLLQLLQSRSSNRKLQTVFDKIISFKQRSTN